MHTQSCAVTRATQCWCVHCACVSHSKQNIDPMWKVLNTEVALGEPTSFFDHENLGCTQRQCEISKILWTITEPCSNREFPRREQRHYHSLKNLRISSWSCDMEGHAKKCVERYCELANKTTQQLYKVSTPCIDDHHFIEEEMKSVGRICHKYAPKLL